MAQATQHDKENLLESRQTARSTASDSFAVVDTGEAAHVPAEKHTRMAGMCTECTVHRQVFGARLLVQLLHILQGNRCFPV